MIYRLNDKYTAEIKKLKKGELRELAKCISPHLPAPINNVESLISKVKKDSRYFMHTAYLRGIIEYFGSKGHKINSISDITNLDNNWDKYLIE